ncbi:MAG: hypothetical protein ACYDAY_07500 [Candidatus Dormibacteria bacterium]
MPVVWYAGHSLCDTWLWDGVNWRHLPQADGPQIEDPTIVWDDHTGQLLLFGSPGCRSSGSVWQTWQFAVQPTPHWIPLHPAHAPQFAGESAAFDADLGLVLATVFTGMFSTTVYQIWFWDGGDWTPSTQDFCASPSPGAPSPSTGSTATPTPSGQVYPLHLVRSPDGTVVGRGPQEQGSGTAATYRWTPCGWSRLAASGGPGMIAGSAWDPIDSVGLILGEDVYSDACDGRVRSLYSFDGNNWAQQALPPALDGWGPLAFGESHLPGRGVVEWGTQDTCPGRESDRRPPSFDSWSYALGAWRRN